MGGACGGTFETCLSIDNTAQRHVTKRAATTRAHGNTEVAMAKDAFHFLMISAMYENGGNTTQRLLDGHPELFSYPFESQPGTRLVADHLTGLFPVKYRWPVFALDGRVEDDYEAIIDEECKVRIKTPQSSKFRDQPIEL